MRQSGGFLGKPLGPLLKTVLPLIKNLIKPLAKKCFNSHKKKKKIITQKVLEQQHQLYLMMKWKTL